MSAARALLLLVAAFSLQGCLLAAAAIPLAAGGAIAGNAVFGERTAQAIAVGTDIDPDTIGERSFGEYALLPTGVLPAPTMSTSLSGSFAALGSFVSGGMEQLAASAAEPDAEAAPRSALLEDPTSLTPSRAPCEASVPAVLIDLDPAESVLPLGNGAVTDPSLVAVVEGFRREGIAIAWITDREPTDAGIIRGLLQQARLDPTGRDPLFVQRYPGETKQERRQALLETHCVLAIAGDERADFDDLYTYIRDPSLAAGLEPMIGQGWFLIPTPID
ncbi:hypothetical protein [Aurantiacibacter sediminis]|uniref:Acid phosphatase n=1 Tax=Aurantiacibacter sediminis TaxID=2793064 RepID=A0ABS0N2W1_9SPHN|nr:hypothetical protein [Aurantiacibacter sediminis]MBH5321625.1 hypothetical protein [Aurantiacibacter sediminis]